MAQRTQNTIAGSTTQQSKALQESLNQEAWRLCPRRPNVLLGVTGSVAAIKLEELATKISSFAALEVIVTQAASEFLDTEKLKGSDPLYKNDEYEWRNWSKIGDPVQHIELRRWADIFVIAPLSANTLAKIAQGLCNNLLTCVVRAWDFEKPLLVAPAMNTYMWESPFTTLHLERLKDFLGITIIPPVSKKLACGDVGNGAMAAVDDIIKEIKKALQPVGV